MNRKQRRADRTSRATPFAAALQLQQQGRLTEAEALYRQLLAAQPRHADSLNLLGVVVCQLGRVEEGVDLVRRAIAAAPDVAAYHSNLGNMLLEQGRLAQAQACLHRAIALSPHYPEAHNNLGCALRRQGRPEAALIHLRRAVALKPDYAEAQCNLGSTLVELQRPLEAVAFLRAAIALRPHYPAAHNDLGSALRLLGQPAAAVECCRTALAQQPDLPGAHDNLGTALTALDRPEEALACFRIAIALRPDHAEAHYDMGLALKAQGRLAEAADCFRQALALRPAYRAAHNNLGVVLSELGETQQAAACFDAALALDPNCADAHNNLGTIAREQGLLDLARDCYQRALAIDAAHCDAHFNLGMVLLAQGDLTAGWREYEWRWQTPQMRTGRRTYAQPQWRGEAAAGRTLLIHAEQGFGDTLQFCRYAPLAAAHGLRVILEVQPPLVRLMQGMAGVAAVVPSGATLPAFDVHCPMLSLPLALDTTLSTIPAGAYLHADTAAVAVWGARLEAMGREGPRIGLVWAGNPRSFVPALAAVDRRRSLPPAVLAPLIGERGFHFISLQKDGPRAPAEYALTDVMDEMQDFADTAALIANLDLVISVDTAVAHLAAGLGRPVWLLDRFDPCWRWLTGRRDSPWYPSLRLYRQSAPGAWGPVIAEVAQDLRRGTDWSTAADATCLAS